MNRSKEAKQEKTKIGVGASVTVKIVDIDEKIREGEILRMRKELFGLYYLAQISFFLVVSNF